MGLLLFQGVDICWMGWTRWMGRTGENVSLASERAENGFAVTGSERAEVNIPFTALRYFKTFEKALIMDMNG